MQKYSRRPCAGHLGLYRYITNQPPKANSAFHLSRVGKWVPALAGKAKAGMVHHVSGWTRGVQVNLWDSLRTRAIPESLRGVITTRCYINPRLPCLTLQFVGLGYCTSRYHNDTFARRRCFNAAVSGGKRCRAVEDVKHGSWEPSGRRSYRVGSIIRYWCEEGYSLYGPVERECQENGTWTDTSPSCRISGSYM